MGQFQILLVNKRQSNRWTSQTGSNQQGLGAFVPVFADEGFDDVDSLRDLTEDDLEKLGLEISAAATRKRLLKALQVEATVLAAGLFATPGIASGPTGLSSHSASSGQGPLGRGLAPRPTTRRSTPPTRRAWCPTPNTGPPAA
jgi:hypothetical protein